MLMKKIIYITCCFVFAGVCSSSEYTLSDSNDNPRAFNSSDSSINDDSKITTHAMNNPSRKRSRRSVAVNQSSKIRKNKEVYTDLYDTYCDDPDKFLDDLAKKKRDSYYIQSMLNTLQTYNFFYASWPKSKIESVEQADAVKTENLKCDDSFWKYVEM